MCCAVFGAYMCVCVADRGDRHDTVPISVSNIHPKRCATNRKRICRAKPSAHQSTMTISRFVTSVIRIQENIRPKRLPAFRRFLLPPSLYWFADSLFVYLFVRVFSHSLSLLLVRSSFSRLRCLPSPCPCTMRTLLLSNSASSLLFHTFFTEPLCA